MIKNNQNCTFCTSILISLKKREKSNFNEEILSKNLQNSQNCTFCTAVPSFFKRIKKSGFKEGTIGTTGTIGTEGTKLEEPK